MEDFLKEISKKEVLPDFTKLLSFEKPNKNDTEWAKNILKERLIQQKN